VRGEANEKQSFSGLSIPNCVLYYEKIAKGGRKGKRKKIEIKQGHSEKEQPCKRVVSVFRYTVIS
jgi:hypothetical protein